MTYLVQQSTHNYIQPNWPAPKNIRAFTTKRTGGYSKPPYDSFNLSLNTGDELNTVLNNRKKLSQELKLPTEPFWLNQKHTDIAIQLKQNNLPKAPVADAAFTTIPNLVCVVLTADCVPILVCDRDGTTVAAIHAGWKGIASGIIETTVKAINLNPKKLLAWLGPAIGPQSFITGDDTRKIFLAHDVTSSQAFTPHPEGFLANIYLLASQRLNSVGVDTIYGGEYCTVTQEDLFFSFRRDGANSGRMASLIWLTTS